MGKHHYLKQIYWIMECQWTSTIMLTYLSLRELLNKVESDAKLSEEDRQEILSTVNEEVNSLATMMHKYSDVPF